MTRKITAKAQKGDIKVEVSVKIDTKHYTKDEIDRTIDGLKNNLHDMLRKNFNHSEIKIS